MEEVKNMYCTHCKNLCSGDYCIWCGKKSIPMFLECPHCGVQVNLLGQFCLNCGKPIHEAIQIHIAKWEGGGEESKGEQDIKCGEV